MTLGAYVLGAMTAWCPVQEHAYREPMIITQSRYVDIAEDIALVSGTFGPLFHGPDARTLTALTLASVASYESGCFRSDVQWCTTVGDSASGHPSHGLWQTHAANACSTVYAQALAALDIMRTSLADCASLAPDERLAEYASGSCGAGRAASRNRLRRAVTWMREHPFHQDDR
jgi:hypothetical protein